MSKLFFITGTDTDAGKTVATAQLLRAFVANGLRAVGMKPVASGCEWRDGVLWNADVAAHKAAGNVDAPLEWASPYRFEPPISPHLAAAEAGMKVDVGHLLASARHLEKLADVVLVEGAGGWFAPLTDTESMATLAQRLGAPVILVVGMRLGCINHAMLTAQAIEQSGLHLVGWLANRIDPRMSRYEDNLAYLQQHLPAPLLAEIAHQPAADQGRLPAACASQLLAACRNDDCGPN
ncbi:dethiobiotin synthetase [Formivibrio citricus]|uniref:ATP-dependent dethiobiotin synthetase BioD n=1 Tax=Formivibrio citricus TaxID=83765 RepID=A0A1I4ZSK1_9NEIS|nr:dethiobiotin synthase [Formivibrio citricus]SFN53265.1 dethiobiotin synthetase [Formivibrio citricus]